MQNLWQLWQAIEERFKKSGKVSDYFSEESLARIKAVVGETEKKTSGEIRVVVLQKCDYLDSRVQALIEFEKAGMQNTRDKTGVLILLALSERKFEVVADEGINAKIVPEEWQKLSGDMSQCFQNGLFAEGVMLAVKRVGDKLAEHFPRKGDDTNELPNDVILGGDR